MRAVAVAPPPPDPGRPGDTLVEVFGVGSGLNLRERPSSESARIATLSNGDRLLRGECRRVGGDEWCRVDDPNRRVHGWTAGRYLRLASDRPTPPPDPGRPGNTRVEVFGLSAGDILNVRERPSSDATRVTTLRNGDRVLRGECRRIGGTEWCRVDDPGRFFGWTAGRYLQAAGSRPDPDPGRPGTTRVEVFGLNSYDTLNVRERPTTASAVVASLRNGDRVLRGECRRIASTDWCRVDDAGRLSGWTAGRYLREVSSGGGGGDGGAYLEVTGLNPFDRLNIRTAATTSAAIVNSVPNGTVLRNLGCRQISTGSRWCNVADPRGGFSGWASERYLRTASAPGGGSSPEPRVERMSGGGFEASWRNGCRATFDRGGRLLEATPPCNADQLLRSAEAVRGERDY